MGNGNAAATDAIFERGCAPVYFVKGYADIVDLGNGNVLFSFYRPDSHGKEVEVKLICHATDAFEMMRVANAKLTSIADRSPLRIYMM